MKRYRFPKRGPMYRVASKEKRTRDGILFDSQKEARRYDELKLFREAGKVDLFLMQVPFHFVGGGKYVLDFLVFWADGLVTFEDVKSPATARKESYRFKKRLVENTYHITITEV
jgi:hypothetical protein